MLSGDILESSNLYKDGLSIILSNRSSTLKRHALEYCSLSLFFFFFLLSYPFERQKCSFGERLPKIDVYKDWVITTADTRHEPYLL